MDISDVGVIFIDESWPRFEEARQFVFDLLYGPFGVGEEDDWFQPVSGSTHLVALADDRVVGYARMLPADHEGWRQIRQVSVAPDVRGTGLGRTLVDTLMRRASTAGGSGVWVNARHDVVGFYGRLGFVGEGEHFVAALTGIHHLRMRRSFAEVGYTSL